MFTRQSICVFMALLLSGLAIGARGAAAQEGGGGKHHVAGVVKDDQGNPVPEAMVSLGPVPSLFEREQGSYARTDAEGAFRIPVVYPGAAMVSCWHPDYMSLSLSASTESDAILTLRRGAILQGVLEVPEALRGDAVVSAYFPRLQLQEYVRVNADGKYRFANLPTGKCELEARAENTLHTRHVTAFAIATVSAGSQNRVNLDAGAAPASLKGTVSDQTGFPVSAQLALSMQGATCGYYEMVRTDATGNFEFPSVPEGSGQLVVSCGNKASQLMPIEVKGGAQTLDPITLTAGAPLRCSFLNTPEGTRAVQVTVYFGKLNQPSGLLSEVRGLLESPMAWSSVLKGRSATLDNFQPGTYTIVAYPLASSTRTYSVFETAELLRQAPVYLDYVSIPEGSGGATVAAAFPGNQNAAYASGNQPPHPILGTWAYEYRGSIWTRTFTPKGRCILTEGPVTAWDNPFIILGEQRVAVIINGTRRIHTLRNDGTLDVEGEFIARKVR